MKNIHYLYTILIALTFTSCSVYNFTGTGKIDAKTFQEKPVLLLSTSPGPRGGSSVLEIAKNRFPFQGAIVKGSFSLPSFNDNFDSVNGITDVDLKNQLLGIVNSIQL